jgi:hypothetical protein
MLLTAWLGDKYQTRGPLIIVNSSIAVMGMSMYVTQFSNRTGGFAEIDSEQDDMAD